VPVAHAQIALERRDLATLAHGQVGSGTMARYLAWVSADSGPSSAIAPCPCPCGLRRGLDLVVPPAQCHQQVPVVAVGVGLQPRVMHLECHQLAAGAFADRVGGQLLRAEFPPPPGRPALPRCGLAGPGWVACRAAPAWWHRATAPGAHPRATRRHDTPPSPNRPTVGIVKETSPIGADATG
jgi:hypothetical protein